MQSTHDTGNYCGMALKDIRGIPEIYGSLVHQLRRLTFLAIQNSGVPLA